jgi:hypothetical protein
MGITAFCGFSLTAVPFFKSIFWPNRQRVGNSVGLLAHIEGRICLGNHLVTLKSTFLFNLREENA